jgi:hypothetical protein
VFPVRSPEVQEWFDGHDEQGRGRAEELRELVRDATGEPDEAVRWGRLTFTQDGDWHHWLCAVAVHRRGIDLVFHKGSLLEDPGGLLRGGGRYVRQIPYADAMANRARVGELLRAAVKRRTDLE